ncbi:MAG: hypothetical protein M1817_003329 [Caeruleum heppii]|nr:MAG: hypothetical protein M1817_003329 [Caeruleum heppii]
MSADLPTHQEEQPHCHALGPQSYTADRLQHATPQHLHLTSRRCFIGPIPEGWLKSHRKHWYKHHLRLNYSSHAATFTAGTNVSRNRQISGLDAPTMNPRYRPSFPQPRDAEEDPNGNALGDPATSETPAASTSRATTSPQIDGADGGLPAANTTGRRQLSLRPDHLTKRKASERSAAQDSFRTAQETTSHHSVQKVDSLLTPTEALPPGKQVTARSLQLSPTTDEHVRRSSSFMLDSSTWNEASNSRSSLLATHNHDREPSGSGVKRKSKRSPSKDETSRSQTKQDGDPHGPIASTKGISPRALASPGLVRFNVSAETEQREQQTKLRLAKISRRRSRIRRKRDPKRDGEIVKVEKMLVRVEVTPQQVPDEYDENESLKVETRTLDKWREFVVVCRGSSSDEAEFTLQLYQSRVIPAVRRTNIKKHSKHEIPLIRRKTKVNLYSSLDKTLAIWLPWKSGFMIYLMRPRSAANSMEWYTFLQSALGWSRPSELQVSVPDLSVSLRLQDPFQRVEAQRKQVSKSSEDEDTAVLKTIAEEQAVARSLICRCLEMLREDSQESMLMRDWTRDLMGLAWKRYDRLEWVHGLNEQKMYGTIAMLNSHELELRQKQHYPTHVRVSRPIEESARPEAGDGVVEKAVDQDVPEPTPVEGFLIRLTSQRGRDQRFGRMFYKRLYFSTHDHYLSFCRPARANPPPPPKGPMTEGSQIPSSRQIVDEMPLIYAIAPFRVKDGEARWLNQDAASKRAHDQEAYQEAERNVNLLLRADGLIDLCDVRTVRKVVRGSTPADRHIDRGDEVDFHSDEASDTSQDDGVVSEFDDDRTFELVLKNGLIIRLEAYDKSTRKEWIVRLRALARYWKLRKAADMELLKSVRKANLEELKIDEDFEAYLGQFGRKWEVGQSAASAEVWNWCGIASCRTITISGTLFHKPRRRYPFSRYAALLSHGSLILFTSSLRTLSGREVAYSHHDRHSVVDLKDCYIYSGLITDGDLISSGGTPGAFDNAHPGRSALPRVWLDDGWTSRDEDRMCCFVVWQASRRSLFRSTEDVPSDGMDGGHADSPGKSRQAKTKVKNVSRLGVTGRTLVFKTRSRAERDLWVLAVGNEIERVQGEEGVRIVGEKG